MLTDEGQRKHLRVRDDIPVSWCIDSIAVDGKGILRNISVSGAMLETKVFVNVENQLFVLLKAIESAESIFVPPLGRVVWGRRASEGAGYYIYGVEFKTPSVEFTKAIQARVEDKSKSSFYGLGSGISDSTWNTR